MFNIAVLVSGSGTNLNAIIEACKSGEIKANVCAVISDNAGAYALERAKQNRIPAYFIKKDPAKLLEVLKKTNTDLIVLAGYLSVVEQQVVDKYENKIINIHPSLIPKFCGKGFYGLHVHEAVLAAGEKTTGATVHYVDGGVDTGQIIKQGEVPVMERDTSEVLQQRVLKTEHKLLIEVIGELAERG